MLNTDPAKNSIARANGREGPGYQRLNGIRIKMKMTVHDSLFSFEEMPVAQWRFCL
ncbi:MAG TPA: hypothetical protein VK603_03145 [Candidatus Saccharimonadales bacterium]|nr:hypothetical protein [Candidatus Saccharimonadales bacterium]